MEQNYRGMLYTTPYPASLPMNISVNVVSLSRQLLGFFDLDSQKAFFSQCFRRGSAPVALPRDGSSPQAPTKSVTMLQ